VLVPVPIKVSSMSIILDTVVSITCWVAPVVDVVTDVNDELWIVDPESVAVAPFADAINASALNVETDRLLTVRVPPSVSKTTAASPSVMTAPSTLTVAGIAFPILCCLITNSALNPYIKRKVD